MITARFSAFLGPLKSPTFRGLSRFLRRLRAQVTQELARQSLVRPTLISWENEGIILGMSEYASQSLVLKSYWRKGFEVSDTP